MRVVSFNITHDSSVCSYVDGQIEFYCKEERITKKKRDQNPYSSLELLYNQNIGKINNRLLNNFGKNVIRNKLSSLSECKLIIIKEKNPAYTSQECSNCHYTNKKNRKTQSEFVCKCCGLKINADVNASRNHVSRSSGYNNKSKSEILQSLTELNGVWRDQRGYSSAKDFKPIKV
mgnify:CR=1 FL=1